MQNAKKDNRHFLVLVGFFFTSEKQNISTLNCVQKFETCGQ